MVGSAELTEQRGIAPKPTFTKNMFRLTEVKLVDTIPHFYSCDFGSYIFSLADNWKDGRSNLKEESKITNKQKEVDSSSRRRNR